MRMLKVIGGTILGFVLCVAGVVMLTNGIIDHRYLLAVAGGVVILGVIAWIASILRQSNRQAGAQIAVINAKRQAGIRTCFRCKLDFEEASAARTPKPWHHTALLVLFALLPIGFGALVIFGIVTVGGLVDTADAWDKGIKSGFIFLVGVAILVYAIKSSRDFYIRCPKCGRACGSIRQAPRGFAVEPKTPAK